VERELSERMKRIAVVCKLLILVAVIGCFTISPLIRSTQAVGNPEDVIFRVDPPGVAAGVGESFTVDVYVEEAFYIYSWQVVMMWDNTVLTGDSVVFGGYLAGQPEGSSTQIDSTRPYMWIIGESTLGSHMGITDDGLLFSMTFQVEVEGTSALTIDSAATKYYWILTPPTSHEQTVFNKENGQYAGNRWPEDINADTIIDIFDIAYVGRDFGASPVLTKSPSACTGGWTTPTEAYSSDDVYAGVGKTVEEDYSTYGFSPSLWSGVGKVEVGVEGYSLGDDIIRISVSWDGGSNWGSDHDVVLSASDTFTWVDVTSDHSWIPSELSDGSLIVKGTGIPTGGFKDTFCDWLPVRVTPIPTALHEYTDINGDGIVDIGDITMVALKFGDEYG
jgi:hypothetical protein